MRPCQVIMTSGSPAANAVNGIHAAYAHAPRAAEDQESKRPETKAQNEEKTLRKS